MRKGAWDHGMPGPVAGGIGGSECQELRHGCTRGDQLRTPAGGAPTGLLRVRRARDVVHRAVSQGEQVAGRHPGAGLLVHTDRGPVLPTSWSPNRIVLDVRPDESVHVNQNPGSWWRANGREVPRFSAMRCAETNQAFDAPADGRGRLVLEIVPRGLGAGLALHALGAALIAAAWLARPRRVPRSKG